MTPEINYHDITSRDHVWVQRKGWVHSMTRMEMSMVFEDCEHEIENIKNGLEHKIKENNEALSLLRDGSEKAAEDLRDDNEKIFRFIKRQETNLRNFKFFLYGGSPNVDVREAVVGVIDLFIMEYLDTDAAGDGMARHHDYLYLSHRGGQPTEDGRYKFDIQIGDKPVYAELAKIQFLAREGLINTDGVMQFDENLTHAGSALLKRLDELRGDSMALQFHKAYLGKKSTTPPEPQI